MLQMINDKSVTLKFCHDSHINYIKNVHYIILITNVTQHKTVWFSDIRSTNQDNDFVISLVDIPGKATDDFVVDLTCVTHSRLMNGSQQQPLV